MKRRADEQSSKRRAPREKTGPYPLPVPELPESWLWHKPDRCGYIAFGFNLRARNGYPCPTCLYVGAGIWPPLALPCACRFAVQGECSWMY